MHHHPRKCQSKSWPVRAQGITADQPFSEFRPSPPSSRSLNANCQCLSLPDEHDEALATRHPRIDQISLQHRVMLRPQRDDYRRVFRALALVDCRRVGQHQLIELTKTICDFPIVEVDVEFAFLIDARNEIAVVDVLVVIVLNLHDLVAWTESPAEPLDADLARRVERVLQLDVERAGTEAAPVHWAEDLDVAYRVEPEALWDALLYDRQQLSHSLSRACRGDEVEVTAVGRGQIGHHAVVDPMRVDNDAALGGLPEDFGQAHHRNGARC